jgi:hypothetical protein
MAAAGDRSSVHCRGAGHRACGCWLWPVGLAAPSPLSVVIERRRPKCASVSRPQSCARLTKAKSSAFAPAGDRIIVLSVCGRSLSAAVCSHVRGRCSRTAGIARSWPIPTAPSRLAHERLRFAPFEFAANVFAMPSKRRTRRSTRRRDLVSTFVVSALPAAARRRSSSCLRVNRGQTGVKPGSNEGQTGVRRGSDRGQTRVRPGSDEGQTDVRENRFMIRAVPLVPSGRHGLTHVKLISAPSLPRRSSPVWRYSSRWTV